MSKGVRLKIIRLSLIGVFGLFYAVLTGLFIHFLNQFPEQLSRALATTSTETVEQFALRFMETTTQSGDQAQAVKMLCPGEVEVQGPGSDGQMGFWSGLEPMGVGHDFRVVRTIYLAPQKPDDPPTHKIWVAFRYTYQAQGQERTLDLSDGWAVYVTRRASGFCICPWSDQHNNRFALIKN